MAKPTVSGRFRLKAAASPLSALLLSPFLILGTTWLLHTLQLLIMHQTGAVRVRPINIGYLLPLVIVTALGGRAVGFITLAEALFASVYVLATPSYSWHIHDIRDVIEESLLAVVGTTVIITVEALRRRVSPLEEITDGQDALSSTQRIPLLARQIAGVRGIKTCRVRRWGLDYYVDMTIIVDGETTVRQSRQITAALEQAVRKEHPLIHRVQVQVTTD